MYLLIDQGNSRCKYVLTSSVQDFSAEVSGAWDDIGANKEQLKKQLHKFTDTKLAGVLVSSVSSHEQKAIFKEACEETLQLTPQFALSESAYRSHSSRTLVNRYATPEALGIDRWLGMIAVFERCRSDFVVIDAGTAITVDWVTAEGQHQGGHIVASKRLLQRTLLGDTGGIAWSAGHDKEVQGDLLGHNTSAAVALGADVMVEGYCRQLVKQIIKAYSHADRRDGLEFWVTGGDGECLLSVIEQEIKEHKKTYRAKYDSKLVFKGLNHWFSVNN